MGAVNSTEPSEVYVERTDDKEAYNVVHVTDNVMRRLGGGIGSTAGKGQGKENKGEQTKENKGEQKKEEGSKGEQKKER